MAQWLYKLDTSVSKKQGPSNQMMILDQVKFGYGEEKNKNWIKLN